MTFTDEDIKRLKERLADGCILTDTDVDLPALVARLEAAEKLIDQHKLTWPEQIEWYEKWKKAAGK